MSPTEINPTTSRAALLAMFVCAAIFAITTGIGAINDNYVYPLVSGGILYVLCYQCSRNRKFHIASAVIILVVIAGLFAAL